MQAHTLTVGDRQFRLRAPCDVADLLARLTAAVRQGGDMVSLPVASEAAVSVLVSPGLCIVLETYDVDPSWGDPSAPDPWFSVDELEY